MVVAAVVLWTSALSYYDLRRRRLPNWLTLPGAAIVLIVASATGRGVPAMSGAAALAGVYLLVHLVAPAAMGAGDVKLALGLGALTGCFGPDVWLLAALGAPMLTAVAGLIGWIGWSATTVPHGPSMCVASAAALGLAVF